MKNGESLKLCARRVRQLERAIQRLLDADEMGEYDKAMEHLERLMGMI